MQEKYKRKVLLGKGATAKVFLVEEMCSGKHYAMKVYENKNALAMETEVLRKLTEGSDEGKRYFPQFVECVEEEDALVMEYLDGKDLQTLLDKEQGFQPEEIVGIMEEILNALDVLHKQEPVIIYRDLKPANIMLCRDGSVRLIDFGAAYFCGMDEEAMGKQGGGFWGTDKANEEGEAVAVWVHAGTYGYAAPEQFWDGVVPEKNCDIYSAGKVLAYLLTGKNPAHPPYDVEQYCKGIKGVPAEFLKIINRSLAKDPRARYEDCESMKRAIRRAFHEKNHFELFQGSKKTAIIYEKCIWKSEYRRIF